MEGIQDIEGYPSYEVRSEEFTQRVDKVLEVIHLRIGQHFNGSCTRITEEGFEDRYIRVVVGIENKEITDHFATTLEELAEKLKAEKIFDPFPGISSGRLRGCKVTSNCPKMPPNSFFKISALRKNRS